MASKNKGGYRPRRKTAPEGEHQPATGKDNRPLPGTGTGTGTGAPPKPEFSAADEQMLQNIATAMVVQSRSDIAARLGKSFGGDRDIYDALGYKKDPEYADYIAKYRRQDIAGAVIDRPIGVSWSKYPTITEDVAEGAPANEKATPFEVVWSQLVKKRRVYAKLKRVDRLASIGQFAVLLLGFDDAGKLEEPITRAKELLFLTPYSEGNVSIDKYEKDTKSERYGMPSTYKIKMSVGGGSSSTTLVDWTRVLHVTVDLLEDDNFGAPKLERIFNRLQDIDLVAGGSSEMFWRGGFPGLNFAIDADAKVKPQNIDDLKEQIEQYVHGMKRYIRTKGMDVKTIAQQIADPSNNISILVDLIAAGQGIPKRILMGSERGELASSMDERNWLENIEERRIQHCEQVILRPLVDRLTEVGVLKAPRIGYTISWPTLIESSEKDVAATGEIRSKTLKNYVDAMGADMVVPPEMFLELMLGLKTDDITRISATLDAMRGELGGREGPEEEEEEFEPSESVSS